MNLKSHKFWVCCIIFIVFTVLYLLSFRLNLSFISSVYTYRGIFLIFAFSVLLLITLLILKKKSAISLDFKDITIMILLFSLTHLLFFCMVPVTIERSFSVSMLSEMYNSENNTLSLKDVERIFIDKYVNENQAFSKRFNEQMATGTISQTDTDTYTLTSKGKALVKLFHIFDTIYNVNSNLLK